MTSDRKLKASREGSKDLRDLTDFDDTWKAKEPSVPSFQTETELGSDSAKKWKPGVGFRV